MLYLWSGNQAIIPHASLCSISTPVHTHTPSRTHPPPCIQSQRAVLTTILPPGPWLRTLTPNHWFSLLSFCTSAGGMTAGMRRGKRKPSPLLSSPGHAPSPAPRGPHLLGQCPLCSSQSLPGSGGKRRDLQCDSPAAQAEPAPVERPPVACTMGRGRN